MKKLFKSNISALQKVRNRLNYSQTMSCSQVILAKENEERRLKAVELLNQAIAILLDIN